MSTRRESGEELVQRIERNEARHRRINVVIVSSGLALIAAVLMLFATNVRDSDQKTHSIDSLRVQVVESTTRADSLEQLQRLRDSSNTFANQGAMLAIRGSINEAHALYRQAIRIDSTNWQALELEGTLYRRTNPDRAIPLLQRSISLNPTNPWSYYNLAVALLTVGDRQGAIENLRSVMAIDSTFRETILSDAQFSSLRGSGSGNELVMLLREQNRP